MTKLVLEVWRELPSLNYFLRHPHWGTMHREKNQWEKAIRDAIMLARSNGHYPAGFAGVCDVKRNVNIIAHRNRLLDQDNLSVKALLDALKRLSLIHDDSTKWIDLSIKQVSVGRKVRPYTIVEISNENTQRIVGKGLRK